MILKADSAANKPGNYNSGLDYTHIVAINAINMNGSVFLNRGIRGMSNEKDKGLDDLFKKKLEDPVDQIRYEEGDWDALEQMLDQQKRKRGIIYLAANIKRSGRAVSFIFRLVDVLKPQTANNAASTKLQAAIIKQKTTPDSISTKTNNTNAPQKNLQNGTAGKLPATANYAANSGSGNKIIAGKPALANAIGIRK